MFIYRRKATCEHPVIDDGGFFTYVWGVHNPYNWYIHVYCMYLGYMVSFDNFLSLYPNSSTCKDDGSTSK